MPAKPFLFVFFNKAVNSSGTLPLPARERRCNKGHLPVTKFKEFSNYSILGRVLLTPEIYEILAHTKPGAGGEIQLTDAMAEYARTRGGMTAVEFTGKHYDMGNKLKVVEAQVELALQHPEIGEAFRAYLKEFCKTL